MTNESKGLRLPPEEIIKVINELYGLGSIFIPDKSIFKDDPILPSLRAIADAQLAYLASMTDEEMVEEFAIELFNRFSTKRNWFVSQEQEYWRNTSRQLLALHQVKVEESIQKILTNETKLKCLHCGTDVSLVTPFNIGYRCYYCGEVYCTSCASGHFSSEVEEATRKGYDLGWSEAVKIVHKELSSMDKGKGE